jgi:hypothetical protein
MDGKVGHSAEWTTRRSMKMIVKAHYGSNGMNLKFANAEMVAMKIPSRNAKVAPEKTPKPAARPLMPPGSYVHPQALAFRAIQWFALSLYEVPLTMPTKPHSI